MRTGFWVWVCVAVLLGCSSSDDASSGDDGKKDSSVPTAQKDAAAAAGNGGTSGGASGAGGTSAAPDAGGTGGNGGGGSGGGSGGGGDSGTATAGCTPRTAEGDPTIHFHHVHYNTTDPDADLEFFESFLGAAPVDFCSDEAGTALTRATKTERGYFLYSKVTEAADPTLNTYLEHVGWIHPSPNEELARLVGLGATLWPEGRSQCAEAAAGMTACGAIPYWFYLQAPSGARIEVALGPGPATMGFGHVHLIQGVDLTFFERVTDGSYSQAAQAAIDEVNHTDISLTEDRLATEMISETRGKPIDHLGYSTTDLEAAKARIEADGITIVEDISFKPEFGFRSFFVKSPKGIWLEIVEDSPFVP